MSELMNRRRVLGVSVGVATAAGLGLLAMPEAAQAAQADPARPDADPPLPPVPGMRGDRKANEVWYQLDQVGYYHPKQEFIDALTAIAKAVGNEDVEVGVAEAWYKDRLAGTYPGGFRKLLLPVRDSLRLVADTEAAVFNRYYRRDRPGLVSAMADFGQGILFDPRRPVGNRVHMMDGNPPPGFHAWHAFNRAFEFLGISPHWWRSFDPLVGFGWAVQSTAKPVQETVNTPLPADVVCALADHWLGLTADQLDDAFMTFPYPAGIS